MGTSYLSQSEQESLNNEFNNLHETFGLPVVMYKTAQQVVISTNPSHSALFPGAPSNDVIQNVVQSGVFKARIKYGTREDLVPFGGLGSQQPIIRLAEGEVRIKLDPTGSAYLADATRATFDGKEFDVITESRPHGLVGSHNFFTYYLKIVK